SSAESVIEKLSEKYLPNAILVGSKVEKDLPLFRDRFESGKTRIFVCRDNVCQLPVEDPEDAKAIYHHGFSRLLTDRIISGISGALEY
ncbi:MAG: hypothetical protein U9N53_10685, partial [Bacteroidota bacterium]|nr:hypothetical protein [Bacteroidota bacterium]